MKFSFDHTKVDINLAEVLVFAAVSILLYTGIDLVRKHAVQAVEASGIFSAVTGSIESLDGLVEL